MGEGQLGEDEREKQQTRGCYLCRLNVTDVWKGACNTCNQAIYKMSEEKLFAILQIKRAASFVQMCVMAVIIIIISHTLWQGHFLYCVLIILFTSYLLPAKEFSYPTL